MESERLRAFRAGWTRANEQFNQGKIAEAWGVMGEDFEYRPPQNFPSPPVLRGPDQIIDYFESVRMREFTGRDQANRAAGIDE
jgi:hypothetical protein